MNRSNVVAASAAALFLLNLASSASAAVGGSSTSGTGIGKGSPAATTSGTGIGKGGPGSSTDGTGIGKGDLPGLTSAGPPQVAGLTESGTVTARYDDAKSFSCHCGSGDWSFSVGKNTILRRAGASADFDDIKSGATVHIQYHFDGNTEVTDAVTILP